MTERRARTAVLPPATPIGWEAEAPTGRLPVLDGLPVAAPFGSGPFAEPARPALSVGGQLVGVLAGVLVLLLALALLGGLLQLTGAVPN